MSQSVQSPSIKDGDELRIAVVGAGLMGADHVIRIETRIVGALVSAIVEPDEGRAKAALQTARALAPDLPLVAQMVFDANSMVDGLLTPEHVAARLVAAAPEGFGAGLAYAAQVVELP